MDKGLILETFTNCNNLKKALEHFHSLQYNYTLQSTHKSSLENNVSIQNLNENLAFYVETFSFSKSSLHWNLGFHGLMVVMRAWRVILSAVNFTLIVNFFRYFSLFPDYLLYQKKN